MKSNWAPSRAPWSSQDWSCKWKTCDTKPVSTWERGHRIVKCSLVSGWRWMEYSHIKSSLLNFYCLEKMFTNSNYFKNYSFHTAESDFPCQVYQFNYCCYYILKNCGIWVRWIKAEYPKSWNAHGTPMSVLLFMIVVSSSRSFMGISPLFYCLPCIHLSSAGKHTSKMVVAQNDRNGCLDKTKD